MITLLRTLGERDHDDYSELESNFADVNNYRNGEAKKELMPRSIVTEKLASRVGASLLGAVGLRDLVYPDMSQYEDALVRCVSDSNWYNSVLERLRSLKELSPLFDTSRWVQNLEASYQLMVDSDSNEPPDILILDDDGP